MNKTYIVSFYSERGTCYFRSEAVHIDASKWHTIIDFADKSHWAPLEEMESIKVLSNIIAIRFISGSHITICEC
jgi:hypothetical protein